jgi:3-deoxy-manno-octulosonate cytidylyltransferase (CMP-KDO synthetase)
VDAAKRSGAREIIVATDDPRIVKAVSCEAVLTSEAHPSGTDRIAEVAQRKRWPDDTIVVNVQGDEPQIPPAVIDQVAQLLQLDMSADLATLCTPITSLHEMLNPNVVKVVAADDGAALYFSRAPIPWSRDSAPGDLMSQSSFSHAHRHLGIYAYRVRALLKLTQSPPGQLEQIEKLEQLRAMQLGMRIAVAPAAVVPGVGVDTAADLERARATT